MNKIILLSICILLANDIFCQKQITIHTFELKKGRNEIKSNLTSLINTLNGDYKSCGEYLKSKEIYTLKFSELNKKINTNSFNKISKVNLICFYSELKSDTIGSIIVEELIFDNSDYSKKAFNKFYLYKKINLNPPPIAPMNLLIFLKNERILILSSESFHRYPKQLNKYSKWILDTLFNGIPQETIEIHK